MPRNPFYAHINRQYLIPNCDRVVVGLSDRAVLGDEPHSVHVVRSHQSESFYFFDKQEEIVLWSGIEGNGSILQDVHGTIGYCEGIIYS